jgi:hypothetical protein
MTILELRQRLFEITQAAGGVRKWAKENNMAFSHPYSVIRGDQNPGRKLLTAMGLRKAYRMSKNRVLKYEDITN